MIKYEKLGNHVFVTKLAGFEHSKYIQFNETKRKVKDDDIPLVQGQNIRNGNFIEKYNYYISKKISDELIRSKLNKKCILIPYVGSNLGEVGIFYHPYDCHMASNIAKIELIDDYFDIEYLKYYLQSPIGQSYLFVDKQGSAQPNITMQSIRNTLIIDKPKEEQLKIVKSLKEIDDKININTQINNNLEELMQTLYQRWFVEFNFPNEEGKPYKASGGKMVWNEELKQEIPEGWKVENLYKNSLSSIIKNGVDKFEKKIYLETADITNDFISNGNEISFNNRPSRANMQPQLNSIWFAKMKNSVKHLSLAESSNAFVNKYILSTGMYGLQCDKKTFPYMHSFINSIYFESTKDKLAHGATQQAVNDNDIKNIKIICPNNSIIEKYSNKTYSILEEKNLIQEENKRLTELRDFLLPMLMNGQINVDDVEI